MQNLGDMKISEIEHSKEAQLGAYVTRFQLTIRTGEVDKERTVDLFMRAKGSRSYRKFAEDMGVNVSSVSRVISGKVTELSPQFMAKIITYSVEESGITAEMLMEAQGLSDPTNRVQTAKRYEEDCRRIFADELLSRGYSVMYEGVEVRSERMVFDFAVRTNALGAEESDWLVDCKMLSQYSMLPAGTGRTQLWLDRAMAYYYRGGKAGRISLIVDHRAIFEHIRDRMAETEIADEVSIILISTQGRKIVDEYVMPLTGGRIARRVFAKDEE